MPVGKKGRTSVNDAPSPGEERLKTAVKDAGVKKGLLMKTLRAALLGKLQGPDLMTTWSLLARLGHDRERLRRCL